MILCLCQGVSDRTVRLAVVNGASSIDAVAARCGAGTDCGSCRHAIQDLIEDAHGETAAGSCGHAGYAGHAGHAGHVDSGATMAPSVAAGP